MPPLHLHPAPCGRWAVSLSLQFRRGNQSLPASQNLATRWGGGRGSGAGAGHWAGVLCGQVCAALTLHTRHRGTADTRHDSFPGQSHSTFSSWETRTGQTLLSRRQKTPSLLCANTHTHTHTHTHTEDLFSPRSVELSGCLVRRDPGASPSFPHRGRGFFGRRPPRTRVASWGPIWAGMGIYAAVGKGEQTVYCQEQAVAHHPRRLCSPQTRLERQETAGSGRGQVP